MALQGPIILVEDDLQDADLIAAAIKDIGVKNEIRIFRGADDALRYLLTTEERPMIILCDIRMSNLDGLSFRRKINDSEYLRKKSIPFVFLSAMVSEPIVNEAYELNVQGFFNKPPSYQDYKDHLTCILIYWQRAHHPNKQFQKEKS